MSYKDNTILASVCQKQCTNVSGNESNLKIEMVRIRDWLAQNLNARLNGRWGKDSPWKTLEAQLVHISLMIT